MSAVSSLTDHGSQDPHGAGVTLAKLQTPVKQSFDKVNSDLKEVYNCLGDYSKALGRVLRTPYLIQFQELTLLNARNLRISLSQMQITMRFQRIRP